jgi:cysteine desulfurase
MPYLDHAATTAVLPEVVDAVTATMTQLGNPSSLHAAGRSARRRVEEGRERIAASLGASPSEVIFTSGGTESDNLAIKGMFWARRAADPRQAVVIASSIEHHAVLDTVEWLVAHEGAEAVWLPVDAHGLVDPATLERALQEHSGRVALVTIMWANNEVGTVQAIGQLAGIASAHGVPLHTDAVQAVGAQLVDFAASGVTALSLTGHKLGGPAGAGALLLRRDAECAALLHGGGQERDLRSGTPATAPIVGLALAVELAVARREGAAPALEALRTRLIDGILRGTPDAVLNGHPTLRLPSIAHVSFPGCEGDSLLMLLDARGIECSTGSACDAGVARPSHVLLAMGVEQGQARGSLRLSLGRTSTEADVDAVVEALPGVVERARRAGAISMAAARSS